MFFTFSFHWRRAYQFTHTKLSQLQKEIFHSSEDSSLTVSYRAHSRKHFRNFMLEECWDWKLLTIWHWISIFSCHRTGQWIRWLSSMIICIFILCFWSRIWWIWIFPAPQVQISFSTWQKQKRWMCFNFSFLLTSAFHM